MASDDQVLLVPVHQGNRSPKRRKVLSFSKRDSAPKKSGAASTPEKHPNLISQEDLEEYFLFRRYSIEQLREFRKKRRWITEKLTSGAEVEDGVHVARFVEERPGKRKRLEII